MAFLVLEAGYLAFAIVATTRCIPFPVSANTHVTFTKGAMTAVAVAWQTIALVPVYGILDYVYSSEWSVVRRAQGGNLRRAASSTDRVSVLTSSWLARADYALSSSASPTLRGCFLAALLVTALASIAPASIFVAPLVHKTSGKLNIANVTIDGNLQFNAQGVGSPAVQASGRAVEILYQEQLNYATYGFSANENALIPWPPLSLETLRPESNVTYLSTAARFNHSCTWFTPVWNTPSGSSGYVLDGQSTWTIPSIPEFNATVWMTPTSSQKFVSGMHRRLDFDCIRVYVLNDHFPITGVFPLTNSSRGNSYVSAFLFVGGNSSVHLRADSDREELGVDLSQVASTYRSTGFPLSQSQVNASNTNGDGLSKLASILVCNANWLMTQYDVTVHSDAILSMSQSMDFAPWNFAPDTLDTIFSECLLEALQATEPSHGMSTTTFVNSYAYKLFMAPISQIPMRSTDPPVFPSNLVTISKNMDRFVLSAAKAYLDGAEGVWTFSSPVSMPATFSTQVQAVYGSRPFLYTTSALIAAIAVLLLIAIRRPNVEDRDPFTLEALLRHGDLQDRASQIEMERLGA